MLLLNLVLSLTLPFSFLKTCEDKLGLTYRLSEPRSKSQTKIGKDKEKNVPKTDHSFAAGDKLNAEKTKRSSDETIVNNALESTSSVAEDKAETDENHEEITPTCNDTTDKKKIKAGKLTRAIFASWANLFISFRPVESMSYKAIAHMCLLQPSR